MPQGGGDSAYLPDSNVYGGGDSIIDGGMAPLPGSDATCWNGVANGAASGVMHTTRGSLPGLCLPLHFPSGPNRRYLKRFFLLRFLFLLIA